METKKNQPEVGMYLYQDGTFSKELENGKELKGVIAQVFPDGHGLYTPITREQILAAEEVEREKARRRFWSSEPKSLHVRPVLEDEF